MKTVLIWLLVHFSSASFAQEEVICPAHAQEVDGQCVCDAGFEEVGDLCEAIPPCPEFASRDAEGACLCDEGYEFSDADLSCLLAACPENADRPAGLEKDPYGCRCVYGFLDPEADPDVSEPTLLESCEVAEPCPGENAIRDPYGDCVCPESASARSTTAAADEDVSCDCWEGRVFDAEFGLCIPLNTDCDLNSHMGTSGTCICDTGYKWDHVQEVCVYVALECGSHAHPDETDPGCSGVDEGAACTYEDERGETVEGSCGTVRAIDGLVCLPSEGERAYIPTPTICVCDEGYFPRPAGELGCHGEARTRCPANAHRPDPESEDCACNSGYKDASVDPSDGIPLCECDANFCRAPVTAEPGAGDEEEVDGGPETAADDTPSSLCTTARPVAFWARIPGLIRR